LDIGGVEGGAICRGVLRAAQELGVGNDWLDALRNDGQRKMLDNARRLEYFSDLISTSVPKPPKSLDKPNGVRQRGPAPLLVPVTGSPIPASSSSSNAKPKSGKGRRNKKESRGGGVAS
jgi:hypothetical protein